MLLFKVILKGIIMVSIVISLMDIYDRLFYKLETRTCIWFGLRRFITVHGMTIEIIEMVANVIAFLYIAYIVVL